MQRDYLLRWLWMLLVGLVSTACGPVQNDQQAEQIVEKLFVNLQNNDLDTALGLYHEDFFKIMPKEHWRDRLGKLNQHLGEFKSYRVRHRQADTRFSGRFYIYQVETRHGDANPQKKANHIITLVRPVDKDHLVKLVGHKIKAKGFK